ncbi:MAG: hypothetical protein JWO78_948 [Micavibrio sp.]|nr:hypothetical protein [Micavibrio sp.]
MESCCATKPKIATPSLRESLTLYKPLIIIFAVSFALALALNIGSGFYFMNALMAFFLGFIAILKLFSLASFAESFAKYDILAKRAPLYARAYPFLELAIALAYFSWTLPLLTNLLLLAITVIGNIGVWQAVKAGDKLQCACVGTGFNLPVGRVTLIENAAMSLMAAMNIVHLLT